MSATDVGPVESPEFRDPYYYLLVGVTWLNAIGVVIAFWALSPGFPRT